MTAKDILKLSYRNPKPRTTGITEVMDVGTPLSVFREYIKDFHPYIDYIKFGIGSALITPNLTEKINLAKEYELDVWFGGTLFEKFHSQDQLNAYADFMQKHQVSWVEISNGTLNLDIETILKCVEFFQQDFHVVAEVGSKDLSKIMPSSQWIDEIKNLLSLGCHYIILEGRSSATSGLYHPTGEIRDHLVADIVAQIDPQCLIFEAPLPDTQSYFIKHFGANVNLGNIKLSDILTLESQRLGLRYETFFTE